MPPDAKLHLPGLPPAVGEVLNRLSAAGHDAVLVGGSVRDRLLGLPPGDDWDAATSARPEQVAALFPGSSWENRFGTVTIGREPAVEVTSYRAERGYADRRRPDDVRFGVSLDEDLGRRDFTINAMAWLPDDPAAGDGRLHDPHGGRRDLESRRLRTVGDPRDRFAEDALRLVRAARFAGRFDLVIDAPTARAIRELSSTVASVSAERIRDELLRILALDERPSGAFGHLEQLGLLSVILPELAALRGVPQTKRVAGDALHHSLAAVDSAPAASPPDVRLAALVHDLGKATTLEDGHFIGHEKVGAELAASVLRRLRLPNPTVARIAAVVHYHMYAYDASWTDAAVRRFIHRTHDVDRELLFALRRADNAASGVGRIGEENQTELEARIAAELVGHPELLLRRRLAIDGHDLQRELGLAPGPRIGEVLDRLAEAVVDDPSLNNRETLLRLAAEPATER